MSEATLHETPRWRDVVLEQIRITALALRPVALVTAAVIGAATLIIAGEISTGGPGFDSYETFPTALLFFLYPFAVWRGDRRFAPSFLWTLPVERRRLALARVFAGWVWMMAALAFFAAWLFALGLAGGVSLAHTVLRVPFIPTIAAYFFGSALVVGLRHPLRWILGAAGLLSLLGGISEAFRARGLAAAMADALATWGALPSLAIAVLALWAAASRQKENR